jgi:hypothetical protein
VNTTQCTPQQTIAESAPKNRCPPPNPGDNPQNPKPPIINILNSDQKLIKSFELTGKGKGMITIPAATLSAGEYYYELVIDGEKTDSKKMVLIK